MMPPGERLSAAVALVIEEAQTGGDVAGWLASVLASSAAALGSTEALLVNRSGSWEAAAVRQILVGTVGEEDELLHTFMIGSPTTD